MAILLDGTNGLDSPDLNITGTGARITGDFSNATIANRVAFQTSTTNGQTVVGLIPNGSSTITQLHLFSSTDYTNYSRLAIQNTGSAISFLSDFAGTGSYLPMTFQTGGVERLRITTAGVVELTSGQLKFPATQVASADANTLDDYEEGTFTPTATFSGTTGSPTYTFQLGSYIKVGRLVTVKIRLSFNKNTLSGGYFTDISGLPFTAENATSMYSVASTGWYNPAGSNFINSNVLIVSNSTNVSVYRMVASNIDSFPLPVAVSEIGTSYTQYVNISYFSAS